MRELLTSVNTQQRIDRWAEVPNTLIDKQQGSALTGVVGRTEYKQIPQRKDLRAISSFH